MSGLACDNPLLSRANAYLTLRVCQATTHVISRRSAHPHFTGSMPNIAWHITCNEHVTAIVPIIILPKH